MSLPRETSNGPTRILQYAIYFIAWLISIGLGVWIMLLLRQNLMDVSMALRISPWVLGAIDKFGLVILGLIWLVLVLLAEHYLRTAVVRNLLLRRIAIVFGVELGLLAFSFALWLLLLVLP